MGLRTMSKKARKGGELLKSYKEADKETVVQGWLKKRGQGGMWQKRWFVLHGKFLSFLKKEPKSDSEFETGVLGTVDLWNVQSVSVEGTDINIFLTKRAQDRSEAKRPTLARAMSVMAGQELVLRADKADTAQRWVQAMFSSGLDGRAKRAYDAEGSSITQVIPEIRNVLETDGSDSTVLRDLDVAIHSLSIKSKSGKLFESKRLMGQSRLALGLIPLDDAKVRVELERNGKKIGTASSQPIIQYKAKDTMLSSQYTVVVADNAMCKDAVKVVIEQDVLHASKHMIGKNLGTEAGFALIGAASVAMIGVLAVALGPVLGVLVALTAISSGAAGLLAINKDAAFLASVEKIPMHEARHILKQLKLEDRKSTKRVSSKRASSKRAESLLGAEVDDDEGDDDAAEDEISEGAELTKEEQKKVKELRKNLQDLLEDTDKRKLDIYHKYIDHDFRLVRFLRARGLNVAKAERQLRTMLKWNVEYDAENICQHYMPEDWILDYAGCDQVNSMFRNKENRLPWYFRDKEGHLAVFVRNGRLNIRQVFQKLGGGENFFRFGVFIFQMIQDDLDQHFEETGQKVSTQITAVLDMNEFSLSKQIPVNEALSLAKKYIPIILNAHPEILYRVVVINAPWLFHNIWSLFKPLFPKRVIWKIAIINSDKKKQQAKLFELFDPEQVPVALGGKYIEDDGEPYCPKRILPRGPDLPDGGKSLLKK